MTSATLAFTVPTNMHARCLSSCSVLLWALSSIVDCVVSTIACRLYLYMFVLCTHTFSDSLHTLSVPLSLSFDSFFFVLFCFGKFVPTPLKALFRIRSHFLFGWLLLVFALFVCVPFFGYVFLTETETLKDS